MLDEFFKVYATVAVVALLAVALVYLLGGVST
jgi:hypothetical protein